MPCVSRAAGCTRGWRSPATCPTCPGWWRRPAAWPRWAPTTCSCTTRPALSIPAPATRSSPSFGRLPGSRSASTCQGTGGNALAMAIESARDGAEPIATAAYPVAWTLHRVSSEVSATRSAASASSTASTRTGCGRRHGSSTSTSRPSCRRSRSAPDHPPHGAAPAAGGHRLRPRRAAADAGRRRPAGRGAGRVPAGAPGLRHAAAGSADRRDPGRPGRHPRALRPPLGDRLRRDAGLPFGCLRQPAAGPGAGGGGARR